MWKRPISRDRKHRHGLPDSVVREISMHIYELLVVFVVGLSIASVFLPHDNTSIWEDLLILPDQIFNRETLLVLVVLFLLIIVTQRVILFSRRQQQKYVEAQKRNQDTNDFLVQMSHGIRTPMNGIMGLNTIIGRKTNEEQVADYVSQIQRAGENLLSNLDEILDFSKIEQDTIEIEEVEYDVSRLVYDCYNLMKDRAQQKNLKFIVNHDPSMPKILFGDEVRIRQIILNILSNAIKYTTEGQVQLDVFCDRMSHNQIHLNIKVSDTGIGIAPDALPHVFDAYSRADIYKIRNVEGTGLGLAITKELVERMGGRIMVNSEIGDGTVFRVRIPQHVVEDRPLGLFDAAHAKTTLQKNRWFFAPGLRVLICDDDAMSRRVLMGLMEPAGIWIDEAASGEECLEMACKERYDAILLDDRMPKMSGTECFRQIRSNSASMNKETPAMMVTANAGRGVAETYRKLGFSYYIAKPIREEELISALRGLLRGKFLDK